MPGHMKNGSEMSDRTERNLHSHSNGSRRFMRAGVLALMGIALFFGLGIGTGIHLSSSCPTPVASAQAPNDPVEIAAALGDAFAQIADQVRPSVVTITSERVVRGGGGFGGQNLPDFFERFFGPFQQQQPERQFRQSGLGSGFIVSSDGLVLTANHVVAEAEEIKVRLGDDRELDAELVGTDPKTDVAVLRIKSDERFPSLRLGDSDRLRVGEWVLALGTPFAERLRETVTAGIVSAKGRSRIGLADYEDFIQTDAAINRGNSGGPLVNIRGEVVGINTAIASGTGGYQGVGFAVPINMARMVMDSILEEGRVVRGWLGVMIGDLTDDLREAFDVDVREGVLVQQVVKDGPAEKAGMRDGDVITEMNGDPVTSTDDFRFRVAQIRPGRDVGLTVIRDGRSRQIDVTLGELPDDEAAAQQPSSQTGKNLGMTLENLTSDMRDELNLDSDVNGVVITDVEDGSVAAEEGLRSGDVILEVDRSPVTSVSEFRRAVEDAKQGDVLLLTVLSRATRRFVALRVPE